MPYQSEATAQVRRAVDMKKTIDGCANELGALREISDVIGKTKKFTINEGIENTTKNLEDAFRAQARNSTSLEIMQVVLAGSLAFDIVDRTFGQYLSIADRIGWGSAHQACHVIVHRLHHETRF